MQQLLSFLGCSNKDPPEYQYKEVKDYALTRWGDKKSLWEKQKTLFDLHTLVIPICEGESHWTLIAVFCQEKKIQYYDSCKGNGK
jgi:hypothetical protein